MFNCWKAEPEERPDFINLEEKLSKILMDKVGIVQPMHMLGFLIIHERAGETRKPWSGRDKVLDFNGSVLDIISNNFNSTFSSYQITNSEFMKRAGRAATIFSVGWCMQVKYLKNNVKLLNEFEN